MVKAPCRINIAREIGILKMIYYLCGEIRTPCSRILQAVQFFRETVKIMDSPLCFSGVNAGMYGIPVCWNAQHCTDRGVTGTQIDQELSCRDVFNRKCRRSMGDKHGWHHSGIPDNYPVDALDLKKIYVSMKAGVEKLWVFQRSLVFSKYRRIPEDYYSGFH
jgi:hypothetical protein